MKAIFSQLKDLQLQVAFLALVFVAICAPAWSAERFTGTWKGEWSNSLGDSGTSELKLSEDSNGSIRGNWDEVKLSGDRTGNDGCKLSGRSGANVYAIQLRMEESKLVLEYSVEKSDGTSGYSGKSVLEKKAAATAKVTREDVEYEFDSITMDGNMAIMKLAVTAKAPNKALNTQGIRLITSDGVEHKAPLNSVLINPGPAAQLPVGVRTIVAFRIGYVPDEIEEFNTIILPGVYGRMERQRRNNPVVLKGEFRVER